MCKDTNKHKISSKAIIRVLERRMRLLRLAALFRLVSESVEIKQWKKAVKVILTERKGN